MAADFGDVRLHTDDHAARLASQAGARAFTVGTDIYFGAGAFAPHSTDGATRLAHELVHVEQQRLGLRGSPTATSRQAEREARDLGAAVAAGGHVRVRAAAPSALQRDEGGSEGSLGPALTQPFTPQLHLDPYIERMMLQHYIRWWLGTTLVDGDAPTTLPDPDPNASAEPPPAEAVTIPGVTSLPPSPIWSQLPLDSPFFTPLPPDRLFLEPDMGALFGAFSQRGAPVGPGDSDAVLQIYRRNEVIARALPDLRGMAPGFIKELIPMTWRRDIASALTGAAVGSYLNRDYMTPIEISDRVWQGMTGASTTMFPGPSFSF